MLSLLEICKQVAEESIPKEFLDAGDPTPKQKEILKKRTKVILNPTIDEKNNDPDSAVSDPYKVLKDKNASVKLKDLAFKIIKARQSD